MNSPRGINLYRYSSIRLSFALVAVLLVLFCSSPAKAQDPFGADIQLRTGDGALSDTRTLLAEPGDTIVVEFFATNFESPPKRGGMKILCQLPALCIGMQS